MYFENIPVIPYEGPNSKNPLAFKYYNPDQVVLGKTMKEHLPFAMAWWHNLCAGGTDMFGRDTADKAFGAEKGTMEHAKAKVDAGFEFMQKLGIEYFCWHDVDIVPEAADIKETNRRLDEISDYILEKMQATGIFSWMRSLITFWKKCRLPASSACGALPICSQTPGL